MVVVVCASEGLVFIGHPARTSVIDGGITRGFSQGVNLAEGGTLAKTLKKT